MRFDVKNFGKIKTAGFELKPLSIIVGKNSMGKSHLLQNFYAWMKVIKELGSSLYDLPLLLHRRRRMIQRRIDKIELFEQIDLNSLKKQLRMHKREITTNFDEISNFIEVLSSTGLRIAPDKTSFLSEKELFTKLLIDEIESTFGTKINSLIKGKALIEFKSDFFQSTFRLDTVEKKIRANDFQYKLAEFSMPIDYKIKYFYPEWNVLKIKPLNKEKPIITRYKADFLGVPERFEIQKINEDDEYLNDVLLQIMYHFSSFSLLAFIRKMPIFQCNIHYLAAARSGMLQAHKSLASTMMRLSRYAGLSREVFPLLPGSQIDFIIEFLQIIDKQDDEFDDDEIKGDFQNELNKLTQFLENEVLDGSLVVVEESLGYPMVLFKQGEDSYELQTSSSMIAELAPIYLLFKYFRINKGDYIIIEEPESHLHPKLTSNMARFLVRSVNLGLNIIVTTHSDFFLKEIDNLIRLGSLSEDEIEKIGFTPLDSLDPSQVSLQLMKEIDGNVSESYQIPVNKYGFDEEIFESVIDELYSRTLKISEFVSKKGNEDE